jgi:hypothetical protein
MNQKVNPRLRPLSRIFSAPLVSLKTNAKEKKKVKMKKTKMKKMMKKIIIIMKVVMVKAKM